MEHKEVFRALVGSHHYNLNTESSDYDYKVFVTPCFDELYEGVKYIKPTLIDSFDVDVHDIRRVPSLLWKANVGFLEILFTHEFVVGSQVCEETKRLMDELLGMKRDIAKMNIPHVYNSCMGMYYDKMRQMLRGSEGTQDLVAKYGYDTKSAMHSIRILDFLQRFADSDFEDFEYAISYNDGDSFRNFLLDVRNGEYTLEQVKEIIKDMFYVVKEEYTNKYRQMESNETTYQKVVNIVKQIVKNEM